MTFRILYVRITCTTYAWRNANNIIEEQTKTVWVTLTNLHRNYHAHLGQSYLLFILQRRPIGSLAFTEDRFRYD